MYRREVLGTAVAVALAGCTGVFDDSPEDSRLDLTVRNDRADPVDVEVRVVDEAGTVYEEASARIDGGVARTFEVTVGTGGRHEATASGGDWRGQLGWNAGTCARFRGTVGVTGDRVDVAGECVEQRRR